MVETPSLIREKHQKGHRKKKQIRNEERENPERNTVEFHERFIVLVSRRAFLTVMAGSLILPLILGLSMHRFLRKEAGLASSGGENASRRSPLPPSYTFEHFDTHTEVRSSSVSFSSEGEINFVIDQEKLSCRHILFDLEKIDPHFLDSEQSLTRAARTLGQHAEKSVSYDVCHRRSSGVDCVVSFGDGRLSLSTWPSQGVMAADLFACDQKADLNFFLPIVPIMEELFGIPSSPSESAHMIWGQRSRGFRHAGEEKYNPEDVDLEQIVESRYIEKTRVHSVQTKFQRIDIWDLIEKKYRSLESYVRSLSDDGSYESLHPEFFKKDRLIFLDNILQSRTYGEAAYHEPLVHPVMLAHNNPRRVAIIGGGEGATLREVLKHKTVEKVIMIEIDEVMVNTSRIYLPEWSDCTNLVGSTPSCFDDPRADVHYEDAIAWFVDNFADEEDYDDEDLFDIIIMDALDPSSVVDFSDLLYDNEDLEIALSNALGDEGILVAQLGEADNPTDPPSKYGKESRILAFRKGLENVGFQNFVEYDEAHSRFGDPWTYQVAMKSTRTRANWFGGESEITLAIQQRMLPTKDGLSPFRYFDGATMITYHHPSRIVETLWCNEEGEDQEICKNGHGFDPEVPNYPLSTASEESIPSGSYVGLETYTRSLFVPPSTLELIATASDSFENGSLPDLYDGLAGELRWEIDFFGLPSLGVGRERFPLFQCSKVQRVYNPYIERHFMGALPWPQQDLFSEQVLEDFQCAAT